MKILRGLTVSVLVLAAVSARADVKPFGLDIGSVDTLQLTSFTGPVTIKSAKGAVTIKPGEKAPSIGLGDEVSIISGKAVFEGGGVKITAGAGAGFKIAENESPRPQDRVFGIVSIGDAPIKVTTKDGEDAPPGIFDRWGNMIQENEEPSERLPPSPMPPDFEAAAKETLRKLAEAYSAKRRFAFMRLVSEDFAGDLSVLEDALVKDFRNYRSVNLDLRPDKVAVQGPSASVEFRYNLTVVSDQGANKEFSGRSSYVFRQEQGKVRLYRMEKPILFGNSLPPSENPMAASQNSPTAAESTAPGEQSTIRGSATITGGGAGGPGSGFKFSTQSNVSESSADILKRGGNIETSPEGGIVSIGSCELDSVTSVPAAINRTSAAANAGECYAVRTAADKYAALRVTSTGGALGGTAISFDYKFQPSGSNSFQ